MTTKTTTTTLSPRPDSTSITLHLSCHCQTFNTFLTLSTTSIPLKSAICHCSICRHTSGQLFATFAVIPLATKPVCTGLVAFDSSEKITRWFCGTCGCSVWNDDRGAGEWEVCTGIVSGVTYGDGHGDGDSGSQGERNVGRGPGSPEGVEPGLKGVDGVFDRVQLWVGATGDGGGAVWISDGKQGSGTVRRRREGRDSEIIDDQTLDEMVRNARERVRDGRSGTGLTLNARCGCGSVAMEVSRFDPSTRFQAGMDACWSCRKTSGFELMSWANLPADCFSWMDDGTPVTLDEGVFGTYKASAVTTRYFCRRCGASVFWIGDGSRDTRDFSIGLLEVEEGQGARFEGWFVWTKYADRTGGVAWIEDVIDSTFVGGLVEGVQRDGAHTGS